ncbi:MAG TPA: EF-hand domain-containing protein [Stellaceae bacterium]|jgi:Ca2+-binding EF-hand superfamily protein|nr:EF-hand domain-containing protein [Stellaceae bacterium]
MSMVGGLDGSMSSYMQQLQQKLFDKIDANSDGTITQSELEQAVTSAGGTTASADALYGDLDPTSTGSVSEQQFSQNLPMFSPAMGGQLIAAQAQNSGHSSGSDPASAFASRLFSQITNGGSTLTQTELEQAVTSAGGTAAAADALYAQLDPNNTGSVTEQQFAANLPSVFNASTSDGGDSATDAMGALMKTMAPPPGAMGAHGAHGHHHHFDDDAATNSDTTTNADGSSDSDPASDFINQLFSRITDGGSTLTQSTLEQAVTSAGGTTAAADALYAQLDPNNTGSVSEQQFAANLRQPGQASNTSASSGNTDTGNSASDAMAALIQSMAPPAFPHPMMAMDSSWFGKSSGNAMGSGDDNSPQAAIRALAQSLDTSSTQTAATGNSAQHALFDLLQADGSTGSSASASSLSSSFFGNVSQQMLSLMIQLQSQNQFG